MMDIMRLEQLCIDLYCELSCFMKVLYERKVAYCEEVDIENYEQVADYFDND